MYRWARFPLARIVGVIAFLVLAGCGSDPGVVPATVTTTTGGGANPPPTGDTVAPTVSLTAPANNSTVSGTVSIGATASDNVGVVGVQFRLNGVNIGAEDTSAPHAASYDSRLVNNGTYALTAVARDAAGNVTTSTSRAVTISNSTSPPPAPGPDTTKPAVSISTPTGQTTFSTGTASVSLGGSASDDVSVTQVSWANSRGGSGSQNFNSASTLWSFGLTLQSGSNALTVTARDAAGNTQTDTLTVTYTPPAASFTMDVAWGANSDNPDGYNIYLGAAAGSATTLVKTLVKGVSGWDPNAPFVSLTSAEVRTAVGTSASLACVAIRAYNTAGVSAASPSTCATLP